MKEVNKKQFARAFVDFATALCLVLLAAYARLGDAFHEWCGLGMALMVVAHQALNWRWYRALFRGRRSFAREISTLVNFAALALVVALLVSGAAMSRHVFAFLQVEKGAALAREVHLAAAFWLYAVAFIHAGMRANVLAAFILPRKFPDAIRLSGKVLGSLLAGYGAYATVRRGFIGYMTLKNKFVFYDLSESALRFFADYLAIAAFFCVLGCALEYALKKTRKTSPLSTRISTKLEQ